MQFSPSIYEHAARLIHRTPWEVSRDAELMFAAHAQAYRLYAHSPVVVGIDIYNLEAQAYGAEVGHPQGNDIPAICYHPIGDLHALAELPPLNAYAGRLGMVIDVGCRLKREFPHADVRIPVSGPFSIAANLMGFEPLLEGCAMQVDLTRAGLLRLARGQFEFVHAVCRAGLDVAFFESAAAPPLLSPAQFRDIELPAVIGLLEEVRRTTGRSPSFVIGGDTAPIASAIASMNCGYVIAPVETNQRAFLQALAGRPETMVRVNMDHRIVSGTSWDAIRLEADRVVELAQTRRNACIGTGSLPYETPPENVLRLAEYLAS